MASDERREIAARLRDDDHGYETEYDFLVHVLGMPRENHGQCDWSKVHKRLADLIDPTCEVVGTTSEEGLYGPTIFHHELSCGHTCDTGWHEPPRYCDECGARIVDDD